MIDSKVIGLFIFKLFAKLNEWCKKSKLDLIKEFEMNKEIKSKLRIALQKLDTHRFKLFFTILACYWNEYKFFISKRSFVNLWCELNELCHEADESFPGQYDDRKKITSYCKQHPYYFIDILPPDLVLDLFCEHLDDRLDVLTCIARKLDTEGLEATYEYINEALGLSDDVDELVRYTIGVMKEYS